jgi:hypothetical protein
MSLFNRMELIILFNRLTPHCRAKEMEGRP